MRTVAKVGLLGAAGLALWALRGRPRAGPGAAAARDTQEAVTRALAADPPIPAIALRASALTARIVELTGMVDSSAAAREAVRRARAVEAVEVVVDRLETRP